MSQVTQWKTAYGGVAVLIEPWSPLSLTLETENALIHRKKTMRMRQPEACELCRHQSENPTTLPGA